MRHRADFAFIFILFRSAGAGYFLSTPFFGGSLTEQEHDERFFAVFAPVDGRRRAGCAALSFAIGLDHHRAEKSGAGGGVLYVNWQPPRYRGQFGDRRDARHAHGDGNRCGR